MRIQTELETTRVYNAAASWRGPLDKQSTWLRLAALLVCSLLLTACPATGGDLLPLAQTEASQLETASFKNDTLSVTRNEATIKARGVWSASDSNTQLTLEIKNASAHAVTIAFDSCEMINQSSGEKLTLRSVAEYKEASVPAFISERLVTIESGQTKKYDVNFFIKSADGRSSVSRNVEGQTVTLRVPLTVRGETNAPADFLFPFKYVEYQH